MKSKVFNRVCKNGDARERISSSVVEAFQETDGRRKFLNIQYVPDFPGTVVAVVVA